MMLNISYYAFGLVLLGLFWTGCGLMKRDKSQEPNKDFPLNNEEASISISVIGDSISTGVLAATNFGTLPEQRLFGQVIQFFLLDGAAENLETEFSRPDLAASTTAAAYGLRAAVGELEGLPVDQVSFFSVAKFGGQTADIDTLLTSLASQYQEASRSDRPSQYVLFMLGGNDFCANVDGTEFASRMDDALRKTIQSHSTSTILVAYLPPIHQLPRFEFDYGPQLFAGNQQVLASCRDFQENSCQPMFADNAATRYQEFNESIRQGVATLQEENPNTKLITIEAMLSWELQEEELSVDCFHPSSQGQVRIGEFIHHTLF